MIHQFDRFRFDPAEGRLWTAAGDETRLRPQAASLLAALIARAGRIVDRDTLYREVWGEDTVVDFEAGLAALMRELRRAFERLGGDARLVETVPRRGYRLQAEVREADGERATPRRLRRIVLVGVVILLLAAAVAAWRTSEESPAAGTDAFSLALLPLESGDRAAEPSGIVLADTLLAELWRADLERLELVGRAGMRPYAGRDDVAAAVGDGLGVDLLVEGSFRIERPGWRVVIRLLEIPGGRIVWSRTLDGPEPALPVSQVARGIVDALAADWPALRETLRRGADSDS